MGDQHRPGFADTQSARGRARKREPVAAVPCPLSGCSQEHELHHAKNKKATPYITCGAWGNSTVWFRSPAANDFLNEHNGGGLKAKSAPSIRKVNPERDEMDRFLGDLPPDEPRENPQDVGEAKLRELEEDKLKLEMWRRINNQESEDHDAQ